MAKAYDKQLSLLLRGVAQLLATVPVAGRSSQEPQVAHASATGQAKVYRKGLTSEQQMLLELKLSRRVYTDLLCLKKSMPELSTAEIGLRAMRIGTQALKQVQCRAKTTSSDFS
jgi:hypothetical protein